METSPDSTNDAPAPVRGRWWTNPFVVGVLCAFAAALATAACVVSVTDGDGLEALVYFPIVGFFLALYSAHSGYRRKSITYPLRAAAGATGAFLLALLVLDLVQGNLGDLGAVVSTGIFHLILATAAAIFGWILGVVPARLRKPPPDPTLLRAGSR